MPNEFNNEEVNATQLYGQQVYIERAIESAEWEAKRYHGKKSSLIHLTFLSKIYLNRKLWDQASYSLESLIEFFEKNPEDGSDKELYDSYIKYINLHIETGNYQKALSISKKCFKESKKFGDQKAQLDFLTSMAKSYVGLRQFKKAKRVEVFALSLSKKFGDPSSISKMEQNIKFIEHLESKDPGMVFLKCLP